MKTKKNIREFRPSRWWSNVTALRVDAGVSEKELALLIGQSEGYFTSAIKNGECPNITTALAIADVFGTTVEEIAFGAIGLHIRKRQLEEELARLKDEIIDAENDARNLGDE